MSFAQISIELFETLKVLASQPGYAFQSGYLGLKNIEVDLLLSI